MPVVASPEDITVEADQAGDRRIGNDLKRYLVRGCVPPGADPEASETVRRLIEGLTSLCGSVTTIEVEDSRVTAISNQEGAGETAIGDAFCMMIQGSDVADFTDGHELQDSNGETIKVCPARAG